MCLESLREGWMGDLIFVASQWCLSHAFPSALWSVLQGLVGGVRWCDVAGVEEKVWVDYKFRPEYVQMRTEFTWLFPYSRHYYGEFFLHTIDWQAGIFMILH